MRTVFFVRAGAGETSCTVRPLIQFLHLGAFKLHHGAYTRDMFALGEPFGSSDVAIGRGKARRRCGGAVILSYDRGAKGISGHGRGSETIHCAIYT